MGQISFPIGVTNFCARHMQSRQGAMFIAVGVIVPVILVSIAALDTDGSDSKSIRSFITVKTIKSIAAVALFTLTLSYLFGGQQNRAVLNRYYTTPGALAVKTTFALMGNFFSVLLVLMLKDISSLKVK